MKYRNPLFVVFFSGLTIGLYYIYWLRKTKNDLNNLEKRIPNILLAFLPILNIFFWYRFFSVFSKNILEKKISPFLLLIINEIYPYFAILSLYPVANLIDVKPTDQLFILSFKLLLSVILAICIFPILFVPVGIIQYYINKKIDLSPKIISE